MMMITGHKLKMHFQMVDMTEVPTEGPIEEKTECLAGSQGRIYYPRPYFQQGSQKCQVGPGMGGLQF